MSFFAALKTILIWGLSETLIGISESFQWTSKQRLFIAQKIYAGCFSERLIFVPLMLG